MNDLQWLRSDFVIRVFVFIVDYMCPYMYMCIVYLYTLCTQKYVDCCSCHPTIC